MIKDWKKEIFTIPNLLSLFRLILIPVYVIIYLNAESQPDPQTHYFLAAAILAVSCLTDLVDGQIARHFNMISHVGKVLDPIADKATQLALIICLTVHYPLLLVVVGLFVLKEGFQAIAGLITLRKGRMLTGALMAGKICTTVLFISLIIMVLLPNLSQTAVTVIVIVDCVFMLISFVEYIRVYFTNSSKIQDLDQK